ncbi:MAG: aminoglycoside phosphotransferase family protein [Candidatus Babeliaceae bacterium]|nr:aminoglycoside phosphotransferase family protein [Candidatus Babeliaceae bacterium]
MKKLITLYQERLGLADVTFSRIEHEDTAVADVYRVTKSSGEKLILKICTRVNDYLHEVYFLNYFANKLPVPRIIHVVEPEADVYGAILMEYLPGALINAESFTTSLAYEVGSLLARIHMNRVTGYGDLTQPHSLNPDPRVYFTMKFHEGIAECRGHLPEKLIEKCLDYYKTNIDLLDSVDGPRIIHRDFRAGNVIVSGGKVQGIIDWSSARASFAEEDFCFLEHGDWPTNSITKKSFLDGYASIRPVPDYNRMMPLLRMSRAIALIGFAVRRGIWKSTLSAKYQFNRNFLETFFAD